MRIACAVDPVDLANAEFDLAVLSECVDDAALTALSASHPTAIVVGAVVEGRHCRARLLRSETNYIDYVKVMADKGMIAGAIDQKSVKHFDDVSVGVVICRDIQEIKFATLVQRQLSQRGDVPRILCITADMANYWFTDDSLSGIPFAGNWTVLSNSTKTYKSREVRCASFIADPTGKKRIKQEFGEPIYFDV